MTDHVIDVIYTSDHTYIASLGAESGEGNCIQDALNDLATSVIADLMGEFDSSLIAYEAMPVKVNCEGKLMDGFNFIHSRVLAYREIEQAIAHFWPMVWVDEEWQPENELGIPIDVD